MKRSRAGGRRKKRRRRRIRTAPSQRQQRRSKKEKKKRWRPKTLADVMFHNKKELIVLTSSCIGLTRQFNVARFQFGYVVECESIDEKDMIERETLFSRDGKIWTLIGRWRQGPLHHDMRWYPRDNTYPIGCKVRL